LGMNMDGWEWMRVEIRLVEVSHGTTV
jgi:hypothetical protein